MTPTKLLVHKLIAFAVAIAALWSATHRMRLVRTINRTGLRHDPSRRCGATGAAVCRIVEISPRPFLNVRSNRSPHCNESRYASPIKNIIDVPGNH